MSSMLLLAAAVAVSPIPTITAEQALTNAQTFYKVTPTKPKPCPAGRAVENGDEIVVCREREDPASQYVPSDIDNGVPDDGGIPRAPENIIIPPHPGVVVMRGCFIPPCPRPPPLIIDLNSIPKPPAGSDADRMAKGEIPTP